MIVTDSWIFVHNPKAGGASVEKALGEPLKSGHLHSPLSAIQKGGRAAFGFVRNPWDRMLSLYAYQCQKPQPPKSPAYQQLIRDNGFKWWLMEDEYFIEGWTPGLEPIQRRSQMWWLEGCDFIGRFENLRLSFSWICGLYGIKERPLPHINASSHAHYSTYYDDESRAFVAEHFAPEIELIGYQFEEG